MRQDATSLERFYSSRLGAAAADAMADRVDALWGDGAGLSVLGLGFPPPLFDRCLGAARRRIAAMPAEQGALIWPAAGRSASLLSNETRLPFGDGAFDRAILIHALEEAEAPAILLRELWRILAPEGRVLVVTANRSSIWAQTETTPFGHGRPWTRRQLSADLARALFHTSAWTHALHMPPINNRAIVSARAIWTRIAELGLSGLGGVVMVEGVKRLYIDPVRGTGAETAAAAAKVRIGRAGAPKARAPQDTAPRRGSADCPNWGWRIYSRFGNRVDTMKLITAVFKPSRLDAVIDALTEIGASGMTVSEVRGYGRQQGKTEVYRGAEYDVRLLPKVQVEVACTGDMAENVVDAIVKAANTGTIGDGKIFVRDLDTVIRIRTGERDEKAIAT